MEYDRSGNVVHVARIPSAELPKLHRSKPDFKIEDKEISKKLQKKKKSTQLDKKQMHNITHTKKLSGRVIDNIG